MKLRNQDAILCGKNTPGGPTQLPTNLKSALACGYVWPELPSLDSFRPHFGGMYSFFLVLLGPLRVLMLALAAPSL